MLTAQLELAGGPMAPVPTTGVCDGEPTTRVARTPSAVFPMTLGELYRGAAVGETVN